MRISILCAVLGTALLFLPEAGYAKSAGTPAAAKPGGNHYSSRSTQPPGDNIKKGVTVPFKPCKGKVKGQVSNAPQDPPTTQGSGDPLKGLNVTKGSKGC